MAFTGMLCRFTISYDGLLLKAYVPRTSGSQCLERDCLEHHDERSLKLCYCMKSFISYKINFLTGGAEIVNAQGSGDKE